MKNSFIILLSFISFFALAQTQQNINKNTGTVSNVLTTIDSIRFNGSSTNMEVVLQNGTVESHSISDIQNVNFISASQHSCGATNVHNPNLNYGSMTDQEGNIYKTIVIGTQEWMAENLKTSHYLDGTLIPTITDSLNWIESFYGATCWYNNDSIGFHCPFGRLYNFYAVSDQRKICPVGWHVPSDVEWGQLQNYLGNNFEGKMKSIGIQYWNSPNSNATNESGFSGLPGKSRSFNEFYDFTFPDEGNWWSSSDYGSYGANYGLYNFIGVGLNPGQKSNGMSVRCTKDNIQLPEGVLGSFICNGSLGNLVQGIESNGCSLSVYYIGGNGGSHPGQIVTSTGVNGLTAVLLPGTFDDNSGYLNYTITGIPESIGTAYFNLSLASQSCVSVMDVSAGSFGNSPTSCGAENVHNPAKSYGNLTDEDGNFYKTIVIGTQEWMAENLKVSHFNNGDLIPIMSDSYQWIYSWNTIGGACWQNNDSTSNDCPYGKLYNWSAVSDQRNVCPAGWHLPSDEEWTTLTDYLGVDAGGKMKSIGTQYWFAPNQDANNESGFSALPGGDRYFTGEFEDANYSATWWSSTQQDNNSSWGYSTNCMGGNVTRPSLNKRDGYSVRCLKD